MREAYTLKKDLENMECWQNEGATATIKRGHKIAFCRQVGETKTLIAVADLSQRLRLKLSSQPVIDSGGGKCEYLLVPNNVLREAVGLSKTEFPDKQYDCTRDMMRFDYCIDIMRAYKAGMEDLKKSGALIRMRGSYYGKYPEELKKALARMKTKHKPGKACS